MTKKTNKYNAFDRINTVDDGSAPMSSVLTESCEIVTRFEEKVQMILSRNDVEERLKMIIYLQNLSGCRISEILNIRSSDYLSNGLIKIIGLKRSSDRLIRIEKYTEYFSFCKANNKAPFSNISRYYVYREYRKLGLVVSFVDSNKKAVTHSFRYRYVQNLDRNNVDLNLIKQEIGHKNVKTTERYEQKSRKISGN